MSCTHIIGTPSAFGRNTQFQNKRVREQPKLLNELRIDNFRLREEVREGEVANENGSEAVHLTHVLANVLQMQEAPLIRALSWQE